jgi:hypothetical protein
MVCWMEVTVYPCVDTDKGRFVHVSESKKVQYCPASFCFLYLLLGILLISSVILCAFQKTSHYVVIHLH